MAVYQRREDKFIQVPTIPIVHRGYRVISNPYISDNILINSTSPNFYVRATSILNPPQDLIYVVSIPSLNINAIESIDGNFSINLDNSVSDSIVDVIIQVKDILGNVSHEITKPIRLSHSIVEMPNVVAPVDNAVVTGTSVTITIGNNFLSLGQINDVYLFTDYRICNDIAGYSTVVKYLNNSTDKYTFTFTDQVFNNGKTYYVFARMAGKETGYSSWSLPVSFVYQK